MQRTDDDTTPDDMIRLLADATGLKVRPMGLGERLADHLTKSSSPIRRDAAASDRKALATKFSLDTDIRLQLELGQSSLGHLQRDPEELVRLGTLLQEVLGPDFAVVASGNNLRIGIHRDGRGEELAGSAEHPTYNNAKERLEASRDVVNWLCQHYDRYRRDVDSSPEMAEYRTRVLFREYDGMDEERFVEVTARKAREASRDADGVNSPMPLVKLYDADRKPYYTFLQPVHVWPVSFSGRKRPAVPAAEAVVARLNELKPAGEEVTFFTAEGETGQFKPFRVYFRRNDGEALTRDDMAKLASYRSSHFPDREGLAYDLAHRGKFILYNESPLVRDNKRDTSVTR